MFKNLSTFKKAMLIAGASVIGLAAIGAATEAPVETGDAPVETVGVIEPDFTPVVTEAPATVPPAPPVTAPVVTAAPATDMALVYAYVMENEGAFLDISEAMSEQDYDAASTGFYLLWMDSPGDTGPIGRSFDDMALNCAEAYDAAEAASASADDSDDYAAIPLLEACTDKVNQFKTQIDQNND